MPSFKLPKAPSFRKNSTPRAGAGDLTDRAQAGAAGAAEGAQADADEAARRAKADADSKASRAKKDATSKAERAKKDAEEAAERAKAEAEAAAQKAKEEAEAAARKAQEEAEAAAREAAEKMKKMFDPSAMIEQIDGVKDTVKGALEGMEDKFGDLATQLGDAIDLGPVKAQLDAVVGSLKRFVDDPKQMLGSAAKFSCFFPMAKIKSTVDELSATIHDVMSGFGAMEALTGMINDMVDMLGGISEKIQGTLGALGDLPELLESAKEALTGEGDAKAAAEGVDSLTERAGLMSTAGTIDGLVESLSKITASKEVEAVKQMVTSLLGFITDAPDRLRSIIKPNVLVSACLPIPDQATELIAMIENFSKIFNAEPINKVIDMVAESKEKGESSGARRARAQRTRAPPAHARAVACSAARAHAGDDSPSMKEPMEQIEKGLEGISKLLKLKASTPTPPAVPAMPAMPSMG